MMKLRNDVLTVCAAGAMVFALAARPADAQGRGNGGGAPKVSTPAPKGPSTPPKTTSTPPSNKPTTPPGQAKQGGTTSTPKTAAGKPTTIAVSPGLATTLKPLFPAGADLNLAAAGFKNLGQFVAAAHVSQNLGIPFTALKTEIVDNGATMGRAIQTLKPGTNVTAEVTRAEVQADATLGRKK